MSDRVARREKLKAKMEKDSQDTGKGGKSNILNLSDYENVNFYKTILGKNELDIFPFEVTTDKDPEGTKMGDDNYKLDFHRHTNVGPEEGMVICLLKTFGKPCPICEARDVIIAQLEEEKVAEPWKNKEVMALKPKRRCVYNVIDLNATDKGMQLYDQSWHKFEKELFARAVYKNPDFILFADFEEGYTVEFKGAKSDFSEKYIEPTQFDFEPRDPYNEKEMRAETFPLDAMLEIPTYDQVNAMFQGVDDEDSGEAEKDIPDPKPEKTTRAPRKSKAEPKAEEKPARRGRKSKEEPEPPVDEGPSCPNEKEHGLIIGSDWDNNDVCKDCPDTLYNACGALYTELEEEKAAKKEEPKKEEKPATTQRRRPKRS